MGPPIELRDRNLDSKAANSSQSQVNDEQGLGRVGKKQILKVRGNLRFVFRSGSPVLTASVWFLVHIGFQLYGSGILGGHFVVRISQLSERWCVVSLLTDA